MTPETTLLAVYLAGLLGGGHCAGMCGGIVGALFAGAGSRLPLHLAYNTGRIASYTLAGAIAGALGGMVLYYDVLPLQLALYVLANLWLSTICFLSVCRKTPGSNGRDAYCLTGSLSRYFTGLGSATIAWSNFSKGPGGM